MGSGPSPKTRPRAVFFDWRHFLEDRGIEHKPTAKWASVHCPFCGPADQGRHMNVSLDVQSPGWHCWRDYSHRGRHPAKLVQALLSCTRVEAEAVVAAMAEESIWALPGESNQPEAPENRELHWPDEIRPLVDSGLVCGSYAQVFVDYLASRGFTEPERVAGDYGLRYALTGPFAWRMIFPVEDERGILLSWTGRSVRADVEPKYRSLSRNPYPGQPTGILNIKNIIYNLPFASKGGRVLAVTEGPFDALKVDCYGSKSGLRATCLFGKVASEEQVAVLASLAPKYESFMILLDADALTEAWELTERLRAICRIPVTLGSLPAGIKDPGSLTAEQVRLLM